MKRYSYPFSAIVGQEKMKTALLLNAVDPGIGGVLIRGQKGTGKSTAVRALAHLLPEIEAVSDCPFHCPGNDPSNMCASCLERASGGENLPLSRRTMPIVELPLSATEDRVVGTLHVEHALKTGERRFDPGLLAAANRGILYVDEVNLLDDHLVDILLDAAASGVNIVEREGISHTHPARFMLVGTMNPEEGDLRPQFLDRFGLTLTVRSLPDPEMRREIVRQRLQFDRAPERFLENWAAPEDILKKLIAQARTCLCGVQVPDAMIALAVRLSLEAGVQGHRSDIIILKAARALAAILEKDRIEKEHVLEAARFTLPHRVSGADFSTAEKLDEKLEEAISRIADDRPASKTAGSDDADRDVNLDCWYEVPTQVPGHVAASSTDMIFSLIEEKKKLYSMPMNGSASTISISSGSRPGGNSRGSFRKPVLSQDRADISKPYR
jgi:Mg-chelatase subunit ChlI